MSEVEFVNGLMAKAPRDGAPEFVKASLSIKREELIAWLQDRSDEWINVDIKEARSGKYYASVNAWKASGEQTSAPPRGRSQAADDADSDIPF